MKKNLLKYASIALFIFAVIIMTGFFWPKEWEIGFQFLLIHFNVSSRFEMSMVFFSCTFVWLGLAFLAGYLDDISKKY